MAKLSLVQFFIAALVFSAMFAWPHAEAERFCREEIELQPCTNRACVAKCKSSHGGFFHYAACVKDEVGSNVSCQCKYHC